MIAPVKRSSSPSPERPQRQFVDQQCSPATGCHRGSCRCHFDCQVRSKCFHISYQSPNFYRKLQVMAKNHM